MKYIQDIDDFDDVGKKILLPSTSTPVPRHNFQRQQLRQFRDTTAATKIQLGETIRNMKNVSPLASVRLANQTSRQILQKYFPNAGAPIQQGNSSLVLDPVLEKHDELSVDKNGYDFITYDFYLDKDHNGKMNIDTEYVFKLLLFVSTDGNKVKECYEVCLPADDEILLFLETDEDTFSERVLYGRVSESIRKTYINTTTGERYRTSSAGNLIDVALDGEILDFVKRHFSEANLEVIDDLLHKGHVEQKGIKEGFYTALKYTLLATSAPAKALGWVLDRIGSGIDYLKITDKFWDTEHLDYYFEKDNLIENLSIPAGKLNGLKDLFIDKPGFDLADLTPQLLDAIILNQIANVETFVDNYNRFIRTHIEKIFSDLEDPELQGQAGDIVEFIALICGIWNGLVDFVSSTFKFFGSLLEAPFDIAGDFQFAMETVDNILALLKDEKLWVNLVDAVSEGMKEMVQYLKSKNSEDLNWVRMHYITGFAMSFVGTFFVPGVNLAKVDNLIPDELLTVLRKSGETLATKLSTKSKNAQLKILQQIDELLRILAKGRLAIQEFFTKLADDIGAWLMKNKKIILLYEEDIFRSKLVKILSKTFDKAPKGIIEYEKKIYEFSKEWAAIYTKEGKIIKDITTNLNDSVVVGKHLSKLEGAIVTHNHPLGSSLSGGDILTFLSTGMKEVRAVAKTDQSVFALKNLGKRFTPKEIRDIETIVKNLTDPLQGKVDPVYIDRMKADAYIRELQKLEGRIEYIHYKP